jgi:hypothetical protein
MSISGAWAFVMVAVVVVAAVGATSYSSRYAVATSSGSCAKSYPGYVGARVPVLVLGPGMTGTICVSYANSLGNNVSSEAYSDVYTSPGLVPNASGVHVKPDPESLTFHPNDTADVSLVTYTVHASPDAASQAYGLGLWQICEVQPLYVGNFSANLSPAEFPWYPHGGSCPAQLVSARIVGHSGFTLVFLGHEGPGI